MSILSVQNLGKTFREYRSEWYRFARWFGLPVKSHTETWVARHINFDIPEGEAVGIVGQNGAGKSTLLKMITGTLHSSEGAVQINGRISAILELGMGFNPDLSGRNNAVHSAGLMGFNATQIADSIDQIEEFAEIGEYFDQPVRTYSSGMQMRVAFAVATAWRPEILIVDEALSVGDAYFQHKCFKRIREFQEDGTSLLIVSHDRTAIQALCSRAILLEQGHVIKDGNPEEVFDFYNAIIAERENSTIAVKKLDDGKLQTHSGTGEAKFEEISLHNVQGLVCEYFEVGEPMELRLKIQVNRNIKNLALGYMIKDRLGQTIFGTNTWHTKQTIEDAKAGGTYLVSVRFPANLGVGNYSIATALHAEDSHLSGNYEWRDLALIFHIVNVNQRTFIGTNWLGPTIKVSPL
jgi:lipopolysaccharide transport system ATP-binding protein